MVNPNLLAWLLKVKVWTLIFFECTFARKVWSFVLSSDAHLLIAAAQSGN